MVISFSMKKWGRVLLLLLLIFVFALTVFQRGHKRVNFALHLKEISNNEKKNSFGKKVIKQRRVQLSAEEKNLSNEVRIDSISPPAKTDLIDVDKALDSALRILENDPYNYEALKLKLKMLLIKEQKFKQIVDDEDINSILEQLAQIDSQTDIVSRREAAILSVHSRDREALVTKAQMIAEELWFLENENNQADQGAIESRVYEIEKINQQINSLDLQHEADLRNNELQPQEILIEIPLYRMISKNQLSEVIDDSLELIDRYPHFLSGYYFLIRALV